MPISEKKKASNARWDAKNMEIVTLKVRKGKRKKIHELAEQSGQSMAGYILEAIRQRAERDGMGAIWQGTEGQTETAANTSNQERTTVYMRYAQYVQYTKKRYTPYP